MQKALQTAGSTDYWARDGVDPPNVDGEPYDLPAIKVPTDLMYAIAMTESSWRSNVIACDGGIGTMQVMPDTESWMRSRFSNSYDAHELDGNTRLGAAMLEWLTVYFGLYYYGGQFDLNATGPYGPNGATVRLGDVVIAAYNVGYGGVENTGGPGTADDVLDIPNQWYVDRVRCYAEHADDVVAGNDVSCP